MKPRKLFWPVFLLAGAVSGAAAFFSTAAAITFAFSTTEFAHQGLICSALVFAPVVLFLAEMIGACLVRKKLDGTIRVRSVLGYLGVLLLLYCLPYWVLFLAT